MTRADRRRHQRVKAKQAIGAVRAKERAVGPGQVIENLSMGGVFVRSEDPLPP
jgi:hypothetical protein